MENNLLYVALCLIVPLIWGLVSSRVFDWWHERSMKNTKPAPREREADSVDMYHI